MPKMLEISHRGSNQVSVNEEVLELRVHIPPTVRQGSTDMHKLLERLVGESYRH